MSVRGPPPLEILHEALAAGEALSPELWRRLGRELGRAPAALRAARAFHPDLGAAPQERICVGTSCFLRGALLPGSAEQAADCLGHCDQSPCRMDPQGRVFGRAGDALPAARPSVRCTASEAVVTARLIRGDASEFAAARREGVYETLERALAEPPDAITTAVERSGECGRGGAAYPTAAKWRAVDASKGATVVIANGDEGDPGSFVDRLLMEEDPHGVLEGIALCAHAIGAREAIVFIRAEYPRAVERMQQAIDAAGRAGVLGRCMFGGPVSLEVRVARGFGSYVCGEETALLEALEGRPGEVRVRPPYPAESGLAGRPTVVHNVETLVALPWIVRHGPEAFRRLGCGRATGTKALSLSTGFAAPGVVEVELGRSLASLIEQEAATASSELGAVLVGGPMGSLLFPDEWDRPLDYGEAGDGLRLGHGGLVAIPRDVDWNALLAHLVGFVARESCGKCLPCREGSQQLRARVREGRTSLESLGPIFDVMEAASLCAFGRDAPGPLRALLTRQTTAERRA